jgi:predicted acyl esterase
LRLAISVDDAEDGDVFCVLKKLDDEGKEVTFTYFTVYEHGPIAQGCSEKSTDYQPWRNHDKLAPLERGDVVEVDIELLAATCRFLPGEMLQLVVGGMDITKCRPSLSQKHERRVNKGRHTVQFGVAQNGTRICYFLLWRD